MGWNSWYIHYHRVSDALMRAAADQMLATGMADYGYQYVNIDDCWTKKRGDEPYRDAGGAVLPNARFPDMKGLADYIHRQGLKAGLYTSPGEWTGCQRPYATRAATPVRTPSLLTNSLTRWSTTANRRWMSMKRWLTRPLALWPTSLPSGAAAR